MANQVVKQCHACKAEDNEIIDYKKRRNILLRYSNTRYTKARKMKERTKQQGAEITIRNRKSEYGKTQK